MNAFVENVEHSFDFFVFFCSAGHSALASGGIPMLASGVCAIADYAVASSSPSISDSISNPASFLICAS